MLVYSGVFRVMLILCSQESVLHALFCYEKHEIVY